MVREKDIAFDAPQKTQILFSEPTWKLTINSRFRRSSAFFYLLYHKACTGCIYMQAGKMLIT